MAVLLGGDYSFARPAPRDLVAAGWRFAVRYASRVDGGKNLTPTEALALSRAGLKILTVWENRRDDYDPLKGYQQGVADALAHHAQVAACGGPPDAMLCYAVDWNASADQFPAICDYFAGAVAAGGLPQFVGCYGSTPLLTYLFDKGVIGHGWYPVLATDWNKGHVEPRAKIRQLGKAFGGAVDLDEADEEIGWRLDVTFAPPDLQAVQRYVHDKTGQPWDALGIIHSTPQGGGYHEGQDLLAAADRAPGPAYPYSDYSYADARTVSSNGLGRDLTAADRLAGEPDAASAFDLGGAFPDFLKFNAWMRDRMLAGDPRTRDIREMIYTLDGITVRRIDRTGIQRDGGDNTHLSHTHFSFYRDSFGRRDRDDNFLGLLKEFFTPTLASPGTEGDSDMVSNAVRLGTARTMIGLDDVNAGLAMNGEAWLSFFTDPALLGEKGVDQVRLRVAITNGKGWNVPVVTLSKTGWRQAIHLDTGANGVRVDRLDLVATALEPGGELHKDNDPAGHVEIGYCVMYGPKRT